MTELYKTKQTHQDRIEVIANAVKEVQEDTPFTELEDLFKEDD